MAKILYVIPRAEYGGTQRHVIDLASSFRKDHEVLVATGETGPMTAELDRLGVETTLVPDMTRNVDPRADPRAYLRLRAIIREQGTDLVHAHNSKAGLLGRLAAWRESVPALYTAHGWAFAPGAPPLQRMQSWVAERAMARRTRTIITVSEADRLLALRARLGPPELFRTIHNGIPDDDLRGGNDTSDKLRILMVGRFVRQKDQMLLAEAAMALDSVESLTLIGDGPLRSAFENAWAKEIGSGRIRMHTRVDSLDLHLRAANCFALISRWEGLPISILEAMRAGLPVVATDVGGVREAVSHEQTGLLCGANDVAGLRDCLSRLAFRPDERQHMGRQARRAYAGAFTLERQLASTKRLVTETLA